MNEKKNPAWVKVCVLGSTSSGNATLVWTDTQAFLIDCGFGPKTLSKLLSRCGLTINRLSALFLTHNHSDHINPNIFASLVRERIPVITHGDVAAVLRRTLLNTRPAIEQQLQIKTMDHTPFLMGLCKVQSFQVPHDSPGGCFGYSMTIGAGEGLIKITIATDMGYPEESVLHHFIDSDVVIIESNHDDRMLEESPRPLWLKKRIREIGHLSNEQCGHLLALLIERSVRLPQVIFLAHISQQCNTNKIALDAATALVPAGVRVLETFKGEPSEIVTLEASFSKR